MSKHLKHVLTTRAESAHSHALFGAHRAMRAGDLVKAERWMRLAERTYRLAEYAEKAALRWRKSLAEIEARRRERIPVHHKKEPPPALSSPGGPGEPGGREARERQVVQAHEENIGATRCPANNVVSPALLPRHEETSMQTKDAEAIAPIAAILVDQVRLYGRAAEIADDPAASRTITEVCADRRALLDEVKQKLRTLGHDERVHGTLLGAGHKAFLEARKAVGDDDDAALGEVHRGEDYLRDELDKRVRGGDLTPDTQAFLQSILPRLQPGHDAVKQLQMQHQRPN